MMELKQTTNRGYDHWFYDGRVKARPANLIAGGIFAMVRYDWWELRPFWRAYAAVQQVDENGYDWSEVDKLNCQCETSAEALRYVRDWLKAHEPQDDEVAMKELAASLS